VCDFPLTNLAISDTATSTRAAKIGIMTNKSPIKLPVSATTGPALTERYESTALHPTSVKTVRDARHCSQVGQRWDAL
jgi:hypothetical protein